MAKDNETITQDLIAKEDFTIDISEDDQLSANSIDIRSMALIGLITPATLTSTSMTFQFSADKDASTGTFTDLYDSSGNQVSITVAASRYIGLLPEDFIGCRHLKIKMGSAEGADRTITAVMRAV